MKAIVIASWDIFLLRRGPERFSSSWLLVALMASVYFLTDLPSLLTQGGLIESSLQGLVDMASWLVFFAVLFISKSMMSRFNQAASAWLGAAIIINLLEIPVAYGYSVLHGGPWEAYFAIPFLALAAWSVMVLGYVLHRALETGLLLSLTIAMVCVVANIMLLQYLFPAS
ncbi:MAG TPA: hypothetical protein VFV77_10175 [Gammaproteobacteria bacterium]|nr:hypothetical protein [Gammaproteobacteria bacterium]